PLGNGKFIARQSHAISARLSGCAVFDPFHLSRFAKGPMSAGLCWPTVASQECRADVLLLSYRHRRLRPRPQQSPFPRLTWKMAYFSDLVPFSFWLLSCF